MQWRGMVQCLQRFYFEIDHEIFSVFILSLSLMQEGQLSISGKRMYTSTD